MKMKDNQIICDNCANYYRHPSGCSETCHAQKEGSAVIPWITDGYRNNRFYGNATTCKGFKKLTFGGMPISKKDLQTLQKHLR
jgi:hypothetical protein